MHSLKDTVSVRELCAFYLDVQKFWAKQALLVVVVKTNAV